MRILPNIFYDNPEVVNLFKEFNINVISVLAIVTAKKEEPSFQVATANDVYFVKFSQYNRFTPDYLAAIEKINDSCGKLIVLPIISRNISSVDMQINVYKWIYGKNLRDILKCNGEEKFKIYGTLCGQFMMKIHQPVASMSSQFNPANRFSEYISRLRLYGFQFLYPFDYEKFFYDNYSWMERTIEPRFVHMDLKPKNIICSGEKLQLVDIDSSAFGDPWLDFYDKTIPINKEKAIYSKALISAYFHGAIDENFWMYFRVLSVYAFIQNIAWLLARDNVEYIRHLEMCLYQNYHGFTELIPLWFI